MDLREYLFRKRLTHREFGEMINYHPNYICDVSNGLVIPGKKFAKIVEKVTNGEVTAKELLKGKDKN